jgi:hypothetical protein
MKWDWIDKLIIKISVGATPRTNFLLPRMQTNSTMFIYHNKNIHPRSKTSMRSYILQLTSQVGSQ